MGGQAFGLGRGEEVVDAGRMAAGWAVALGGSSLSGCGNK